MPGFTWFKSLFVDFLRVWALIHLGRIPNCICSSNLSKKTLISKSQTLISLSSYVKLVLEPKFSFLSLHLFHLSFNFIFVLSLKKIRSEIPFFKFEREKSERKKRKEKENRSKKVADLRKKKKQKSSTLNAPQQLLHSTLQQLALPCQHLPTLNGSRPQLPHPDNTSTDLDFSYNPHPQHTKSPLPEIVALNHSSSFLPLSPPSFSPPSIPQQPSKAPSPIQIHTVVPRPIEVLLDPLFTQLLTRASASLYRSLHLLWSKPK